MPANNNGKRGCFTADDVRNICCQFACSQGFYGRFVRDHDEADDWQEIADAANDAGCTDTVDFVCWLEG